MSRKDTDRRYGSLYGRTRTKDFSELVDCMYRVLTRSVNHVTVPTGTEFALVHNGEQNLVVKILNLTDEFLFNGEKYTCEAQELYDSVEEFFEAFNWTNPDDGLDRRFIFSVHLLNEAQQAEREHPSGVFLLPAPAAS